MKSTAIKILALIAGYFGVAYFIFPALFPPFYYADFNKARDQLASIPGVEIIDDWQHRDVLLESCGFTLRVNDSEPVQIRFNEGNDWEAPFAHLDGVIVSYPNNPEINDYEELFFSSRQLEAHGIDPTNLGTMLQDIEKLLAIAKPLETPQDRNLSSGVWVRIYRDLDRYKKSDATQREDGQI